MKTTEKKVPLGNALNTSDSDLDLQALITPSDIEAAKADGRARMSKRGALLLETARAAAPTPPEGDADAVSAAPSN